MARRSTEALGITMPDFGAMIAERAYFKAERRGFAPGYELEDWLAAEREVTAMDEKPKKSRKGGATANGKSAKRIAIAIAGRGCRS